MSNFEGCQGVRWEFMLNLCRVSGESIHIVMVLVGSYKYILQSGEMPCFWSLLSLGDQKHAIFSFLRGFMFCLLLTEGQEATTLSGTCNSMTLKMSSRSLMSHRMEGPRRTLRVMQNIESWTEYSMLKYSTHLPSHAILAYTSKVGLTCFLWRCVCTLSLLVAKCDTL